MYIPHDQSVKKIEMEINEYSCMQSFHKFIVIYIYNINFFIDEITSYMNTPTNSTSKKQTHFTFHIIEIWNGDEYNL